MIYSRRAFRLKIGIYGYGNLGRGVECATSLSSDAELVGIFTRRPPGEVVSLSGASVYPASSVLDFKDDIEVLVICGGSATDLPVMTPYLARHFNVVDSFDAHNKIPEHFEAVDDAAKIGGKVAVISAGWDPGLFSIIRAYFSAFLPDGNSYTFWGSGVSQGHSDAIRHIPGVIDARQYTIPYDDAIRMARVGAVSHFSANDMHYRECYVVAEDSADTDEIEREIRSMPGYFAGYDTAVHFITLDELRRYHYAMPHGGHVIRNGRTGQGGEHIHTAELSLSLDSNPEFTGSVMVSVARAAHKMSHRGEIGCKTLLDIPPADYLPNAKIEARKRFL